jgi:hypothetical protein
MFIGCVESDRKESEKSSAAQSSSKTESKPETTASSVSSCESTWQQVAEAVQKCKDGGKGASVKKDGQCYVFGGCVERNPEENRSASSKSAMTTEVSSFSSKSINAEGTACKKMVKNGCIRITCADGFAFNSCEMGDMSRKMMGKTNGSAASRR